MKKLMVIAGILLVVCFAVFESGLMAPGRAGGSPSNEAYESILAGAIESRASGLHVQGSGVVTKVLPDDSDGSRHQRFILQLASRQTLLIAHNIDIAPRIVSIRPGDSIEFAGEYEWNPQGGVIHWTHRDPGGRHGSGWLKHNGSVYQ